ncbi:MAG: alpha/beta fold hydrolase [Streptosporangiaceae bacterium]
MTSSAVRDRPPAAGSSARSMPDAPGVTHRFVEARGARFHVALAGSENGGEPVVLLHGLPQHWYAWRLIIPHMADRYRLYCVDLRGCGWSEATGPASGYRTAELARDVLAVLDALGLADERVRLIGHDAGGWVGFELCLRAPERFSRFVALNVTHPWPGRAMLARHAWRFWYTAFWEYPVAGRVVLRRWPRFTRARLRQWAGRFHHWDEAALDEFVAAAQTRQAARAIQAMLWQFVLRDIPALVLGTRARRLTVPTLLLAGELDPVSRGARATRQADSLRVEVVPGAHLLPESAPGLVAAAAFEHFG